MEKSFREHETAYLSNEIPEPVKTQLDRAVAGTDSKQGEVLTALIDAGLDNDEPPVELSNKVEERLSEWSEE